MNPHEWHCRFTVFQYLGLATFATHDGIPLYALLMITPQAGIVLVDYTTRTGTLQ